MTGWKTKDLLDMLKKAQEGDAKELNHMTASYTSGCAVNKEYSTMIIKQLFVVEDRDNERRVLDSFSNRNEEYKASKDKQWGLTILQLTPQNKFIGSYCLPNELKRAKILLLDNNRIEIRSKKKTITSSIIEIEQKLKPILGVASKSDIQNAFNTLSSQQYTIELEAFIESKSFGTLELEDEEYGTVINLNDTPVRIIVYLPQTDKPLLLVEHADKLMADKFYEKALKAMYPEMLELKNDYWHEANNDDNDEAPNTINLDEFKKRITIKEITFNHDYTVTLTCDADEMFDEHDIIINTDDKGYYRESMLDD